MPRVAAAGKGTDRGTDYAQPGKGGRGSGRGGGNGGGIGGAGKGTGKGSAGKGTPGKGGGGAKGGTKGGTKGGRGKGNYTGGRGQWQPAELAVKYTDAFKNTSTGKGETRTKALALTGEKDENNNIRKAVDATFPGVLDLVWNRDSRAHHIQTTGTHAFDLTPEMANEVMRNIKTYTMGGICACPRTAQMIEQVNLDCVASNTSLEHDVNAPHMYMQYTNCLHSNEIGYLPNMLWVWGNTYPFKAWFMVRSRKHAEKTAHAMFLARTFGSPLIFSTLTVEHPCKPNTAPLYALPLMHHFSEWQ